MTTEAASTPRIWTIPAGVAFADALAAGLWAECGHDPLKLSAITLLLPTRRAARNMREAFLRLSDGRALLLPQMAAIGDVDPDEMALVHAGDDALASALDLPPAITPLQRQVLLAGEIQKADPEQSFDQAAALALALGRFLDEAQNHGLNFDGLQKLVPDEFAGHWQQTLDRLKIIIEDWPRLLAARGLMDAAERRTRLLQAQIAAWTKTPPDGPVIAAGTTGTTPAAGDLLCLIAKLPQGRLVLPGLDLALDDAAWAAVGDEHPQSGLKALLARAGLDRRDVAVWPWRDGSVENVHRARWLSEAMRPAETTEHWRALTGADIPENAVRGLLRIDCDTPQMEADLIALLMRETLETPEKTAALVTPDRRLARRVTQSLKRWGIQIDDTGGQPLTEVMAGSYLMLLADMAEQQMAPVATLAFLKHTLTAMGLPAQELRETVYLLDQLGLRGPRPRGGFDGLRQALLQIDERRAGDRDRLLAWLSLLQPMAEDFVAAMAARKPQDFQNLLQLHIELAERVAATTDHAGAFRVWRGEGGEAAGLFLSQLRGAAADIPPVTPQQYVSVLGNFLKGVTVRPHYGSHPRLFIYGLIEARLASADRMILGGLNEGTWPALPAQDPWLSRPMRRDFGLPSPEQDVALSAHDFVQGASRAEVVLTRARKVDGTPTVPARWLLRMETVLKAAGRGWPEKDAETYRHWLRALDEAGTPQPAPRPAPAPPVDARPKELSVTQVETWLRDPYQIYARHVLGLRALDAIDDDPGGMERGIFIHRALELFVAAYPKDLPGDAVARLTDFGRQALAELAVAPEVEAFWWPRFERVAEGFVAKERAWRQDATFYQAEKSGRLVWPDFTLKGKADRIDRFADGHYALIDYKTGSAPSKKEVYAGLSPQLPLEALMLRHGAFDGIPAGETASMSYWATTGHPRQPLKVTDVQDDKNPASALADAAAEGLRGLIDAYNDPATPYFSQPHADIKAKGDDYDHLARVKEWGTAEDDVEDAA